MGGVDRTTLIVCGCLTDKVLSEIHSLNYFDISGSLSVLAAP